MWPPLHSHSAQRSRDESGCLCVLSHGGALKHEQLATCKLSNRLFLIQSRLRARSSSSTLLGICKNLSVYTGQTKCGQWSKAAGKMSFLTLCSCMRWMFCHSHVSFSGSIPPAAPRGLDMCVFSGPFPDNKGPFPWNVVVRVGPWFSKGMSEARGPSLSAAERMCEIGRGWEFNTLSPDYKPVSVPLKDGQGETETKDLYVYIQVDPEATSQQFLRWEPEKWWTGYKKQDFNREQQSGSLTFNR